MAITTLITGANRGIGRAIAERLAALGHNLFLLARDQQALDESVAACRAKTSAGGIASMAGELVDTAYMDAAIAAAQQRFGHVDVLINNAGSARMQPVHEADMRDWRSVMDVNFDAALYLSRYLLPPMIERGSGALINISSINGRSTNAGGGIYCASKHALNALTECTFEDVRDYGIKVSSIMPGFVHTDLTDGLGMDADKMIAPDDVADSVAYILSTSSSAFAVTRERTNMSLPQVALDHIVIAHPNLDQAREEFADLTGCAPAYGGPHVGGGTHNALVSLGDSVYVELISPDPDQLGSDQGDKKGGLADRLSALRGSQLLAWAARSSSLDEVGAAINQRDAGIKASAPFAMARKQPDGTTLNWQLMNLSQHELAGFAPFYIDWLRCPHPTTTNPVAGQFESFVIRHPDNALQALAEGVDNVVAETGAPQAVLRFTAPKGVVEIKADSLPGFWG